MAGKKVKGGGMEDRPLPIPSFISESFKKAIINHDLQSLQSEKNLLGKSKKATRSLPCTPRKSIPRPSRIRRRSESVSYKGGNVLGNGEEDECETRIDEVFSQEVQECRPGTPNIEEGIKSGLSSAPLLCDVRKAVERDSIDVTVENPSCFNSPLANIPGPDFVSKTQQHTILDQINCSSVNLTVFISHIWVEPLQGSSLFCRRVLIRDFGGVFSVLLLAPHHFNDRVLPGNLVEFSNLVPCDDFAPSRKRPFLSIIKTYGSDQDRYYVLTFGDDTSLNLLSSEVYAKLFPLVFMLKGSDELTCSTVHRIVEFTKINENECRAWGTGQIKNVEELSLILEFPSGVWILVKFHPNFVRPTLEDGVTIGGNATLEMLRIVKGEVMLDIYSTITIAPLEHQPRGCSYPGL